MIDNLVPMTPLSIFRSGSYILHYATFGLAMLTWSIIIIMSFVRTIIPGAGVSPRLNFPVNRPLIVSTMDGVEIKN